MYTFKEGEYLTERSLGELLCNLFGSENVERQFKIGVYKADFKVGNLLVEFDGYRHYSQSKTILRDFALHDVAEENGLRVMHVPYFIQYKYVCEALGFADKDFGYAYPNGFIDAKALRPKDFSTLGCLVFSLQLDSFSEAVKTEILATMDDLDLTAYKIGTHYDGSM